MGSHEPPDLHSFSRENKPCFYMHPTLKQTKMFFISMVIMPLVLAIFVAVIVGFYIRTAFAPVMAVLSDPAVDTATSAAAAAPESSIPVIAIAAGVCAFLMGSVLVAGMFFLRKAMRSKKAIERCSNNGTVIVEPPYSLAIAQYMYSKVVVDLSRTDFTSCDAADFPLEKIRNLTEVRIRETNVPDSIILKLPRCKSLKRIDLSGSELSNEAAQSLSQLTGIEFVLDGIAEQSEVVEVVWAEMD